jgi:hypothetical protein
MPISLVEIYNKNHGDRWPASICAVSPRNVLCTQKKSIVEASGLELLIPTEQALLSTNSVLAKKYK